MTARRNPTRPHHGLRELAQWAVVTLGWIGFVWLWVLVGQRPWESERLLWLIVGSIVALPLITLAWVMHNRAIYRRKGERMGVLQSVPAYTHDWHGRSVEADWDTLRRSDFVAISLQGECKLYSERPFGAPGPASAPVDSPKQGRSQLPRQAVEPTPHGVLAPALHAV